MAARRGRCFGPGTLYVLITSGFAERPLLESAAEVIEGGADVVQLREKNLPDRELLAAARELRRMTRTAGVRFILNDRPDIAALADADGVHLGQEDLPPAAARAIVGPRRWVGVSTHILEEARSASRDGADYVGVGPIFATRTKGYERGLGTECVRAVKAALDLPVVAIGGITLETVEQVAAAGADAVAVCSAILAADDVRSATRAFKAALSK